MKMLLDLVETGEHVFSPVPMPTPDEMLAAFDRHDAALTDRVTAMPDAAWDRSARVVAGAYRNEMPLGAFLFNFHHDMIHHRGQLTVYIRPMGGKVPSVCGPSADDPGAFG